MAAGVFGPAHRKKVGAIAAGRLDRLSLSLSFSPLDFEMPRLALIKFLLREESHARK